MFILLPRNHARPRTMGSYLRGGMGSYLRGPRGRRLRGLRLGDDVANSGYSDPITGEWIDTSGQAAQGAIGPGIQPDVYVAPNPIAPGTAAPVGQNYNPQLVSYFQPSPIQAAQMAVNSLTPAPQVGVPVSGSLSVTTKGLLYIGAGVAALALLTGGRRR